MRGSIRTHAFAAAALALSACGNGEQPPKALVEDDPATIAALSDPITIDPDLARQNRADSVAFVPSQDGSLPTIDSGAEAVAAARAEALQLVGGPGKLRPAPDPVPASGTIPAGAAFSAAARAAVTSDGEDDCAARVQYTMQWAARLPAAFPVYPRGAVQEAAGTDEGGCSLRVVNFVTPVPLGEVMDFYYSRARAAGFSARRVLQDGDDVLAGARGSASYVIYARRLASGNTEVDLVTNGG
jgi:hypothetical protein